jgi:hypothetical protein
MFEAVELQTLDRVVGLFEAGRRVVDQPEHRGPEADGEGASLGVPALVLADRLGADPEAEAEADAARERRWRCELRRPACGAA